MVDDLAAPDKPVGVIDIGSNTVRLVVYSGLMRAPVPIYNEKSICALGKGLESSGCLNPDGIHSALKVLSRFKTLATMMHVERLDILATAAVRDARDGRTFIKQVKEYCDLEVKVLSGQEEAQRSALGVICSVPDADGLVCDLGGGSLELVEVSAGRFGQHATLPLGTLRLSEAAGNSASRALLIIDKALAEHDWIAKGLHQNIYAVGGAWRALAKVCVAQLRYPLHILDNFTLSKKQALSLFDLISHLSIRTLEKIKGIDKHRLATLPLAAVFLQRIIEKVSPINLIFSVYGMREGQFFRDLSEQVKQLDPLISSAEVLCRSVSRPPAGGYESMEWMSPLFSNESEKQKKLRLAACLLRDICWSEHPDYRAEQALLRALRLPLMGLEHEDRAGLALALYYRYRTDDITSIVSHAQSMLSAKRIHRVQTIGLALRLAYSLSAGVPGILPDTRLELDQETLDLRIPDKTPVFRAGPYPKRLSRLAEHIGVAGRITPL